ncbi:class I SAM-dependent methyltransferase [Desulfuromonas sp. AOP6]|uniref:class I SAM-dependent methyltransferase n=1 Tax=Desulfuromonas sp. AOP6 TaxID=1566351 RepID=UPI0012729ABF|nr:class I SAM-dependent methyltransferase [Desulfuromonas sp. AOP6]BCA80096.1 hypothetical protein AOP6_1883 [Desulfuromonas sp. AOP6]
MPDKQCWDTPWPENELERVFSCPICGAQSRKLLYEQLVDNVFFVANGKWNLYQCRDCTCAYLDPRPDRNSIHKAYGTYYTHETVIKDQKPFEELSKLRKFRRMLVNGYCNYHHGTKRTPAIGLGAVLLLLYPHFRKAMKAQFRYLPKPQVGQTLLDVGCGNGDFLSLVAEVGWNVKGVDPDPKALTVARENGLDVLEGGVEQFSDMKEVFDAITINHVIEHVHDPAELVSTAYRLLKPGGILYIDTPNIESLGVSIYGKNWRGLETPRHLVLFSNPSLRDFLRFHGFVNIKFYSRQEVRKNIALKSYRMKLGQSPYDGIPTKLPFFQWLKSIFPRTSKNEEFLTALVEKPK